jgi:ABC-2 type transport system permease protein
MILIFGYTFGGDVSNVDVEIVNHDKGIPPSDITYNPFSNGLMLADNVTTYISTETLSLHFNDNINLSRQKVDDGKAWAVIIFPENFSENFRLSLANPELSTRSEIEIYLDGSNPTIAAAILETLSQAIQQTMSILFKTLNITQVNSPLTIKPMYAYGGGNTRFIDYFAPGVISFAIMMVTTMITIILFVNERRNGTLQRLLVSPASESEIVVGYALAFAVIGLFQSIVVLFAAILLFNITISGNIFLALMVIMLIGFGHQGLGILLSAGAKNELQAIQFIPLIIFPSVLLAGLFWPIESIPSLLKPISYLVPLRYGIDAERSIMLRGWNLGEIWIDVLILIVFAILTLAGSIILLKRKK